MLKLAMKVNIALIVGILAATTALAGYLFNAAAGRRIERARRFADALAAVERYKQLPYTFARLHDGTTQSRIKLAELLGETQVELSFNRRWLALESPELSAAYEKLVHKIKELNRTFRKEALARPASTKDADIEFDSPYDYNEHAERMECIRIMRRNLSVFRLMT
jgi:hypothetical protein